MFATSGVGEVLFFRENRKKKGEGRDGSLDMKKRASHSRGKEGGVGQYESSGICKRLHDTTNKTEPTINLRGPDSGTTRK